MIQTNGCLSLIFLDVLIPAENMNTGFRGRGVSGPVWFSSPCEVHRMSTEDQPFKGIKVGPNRGSEVPNRFKILVNNIPATVIVPVAILEWAYGAGVDALVLYWLVAKLEMETIEGLQDLAKGSKA